MNPEATIDPATDDRRSERPRIDDGPIGTITFLFTDIDGSGALWEQAPERMSDVVARIDGLLRRAARAHGGYLFKTVADATYAAFDTAPDALRAAIHAQRLLGGEPWPPGLVPRVRMALHIGAAEHRDGDYFGPPLNRVARLERRLPLLTGGAQKPPGPPADTARRDHLELRLAHAG